MLLELCKLCDYQVVDFSSYQIVDFYKDFEFFKISLVDYIYMLFQLLKLTGQQAIPIHKIHRVGHNLFPFFQNSRCSLSTISIRNHPEHCSTKKNM